MLSLFKLGNISNIIFAIKRTYFIIFHGRKPVKIMKMFLVERSVSDPYSFYVDPDPDYDYSGPLQITTTVDHSRLQLQ